MGHVQELCETTRGYLLRSFHGVMTHGNPYSPVYWDGIRGIVHGSHNRFAPKAKFSYIKNLRSYTETFSGSTAMVLAKFLLSSY